MNRWYKALCGISALPLLVLGFFMLRALIMGFGNGGDTGVILLAIFFVIALVATLISYGAIAFVLWLSKRLPESIRSIVLIICWVPIALVPAAAVFKMLSPFFFPGSF